MSRLKRMENVEDYIRQIRNMVTSLLCDQMKMKCVKSASTYQFFSCPIRLIEELELTHPFHSIVMQSLEIFHKKYDGCSSKTLLFIFTTLYSHLQEILANDNRVFQTKIFDHLEELIEQSKFIAQQQFSEILSIDSSVFPRICRYQTIYANVLFQAYEYFHSLQSQISHAELLIHFSNLTHLTRVKTSEEKCLFIPATILPDSQSIHGCRRTIFIDGYLLEEYVHLGYNNKLPLQQTSRQSSWISLISSILTEHSIEVILCSGTIDSKLIDIQRIFLQNIPTKTLRLLGGDSILNYLTDLTEEHILLLNYTQLNVDSSLTIIEKGYSILHYIPLETFVDVKTEQFLHCLGRFRQILRKNFYLNGSGELERRLYEYWYDQKGDISLEKNLANDCIRHCLQAFVREISQRNECFVDQLIDDFDSKFEAWKTSLELLKILMQIDYVSLNTRSQSLCKPIMLNIRSYPLVRLRRLMASPRPLLILGTILFSILLILIYLYSHDHYQKEHLPRIEVILPNGTKIFLNEKDPRMKIDEPDHWHDKIKETLQDSANFGFIHAFIASISVIVVSELGDKTFFIAAIMAMRHSRLIIYAGAMSALGAMTILSALLGNIVTKFVPRIYTYYLSSFLFACFGIKMLRDGYIMSPDEGTGEYEEAQHEVENAEATDDLELGGTPSAGSQQQQQQRLQSASKQRSTLTKFTTILRRYLSPILIQAFIMTFLAEWGDRSQITTIVLAASENLFGVIVGGTIGHGLCTGLAVIGGRFVAQRISVKTVTLIGGIVFICFAFSAFFIRPDA